MADSHDYAHLAGWRGYHLDGRAYYSHLDHEGTQWEPPAGWDLTKNVAVGVGDREGQAAPSQRVRGVSVSTTDAGSPSIPEQSGKTGDSAGGGGGRQDMTRLDAVVRVLKATGHELHYSVITHLALQEGMIQPSHPASKTSTSMMVSFLFMYVFMCVHAQHTCIHVSTEGFMRVLLAGSQCGVLQSHPPPSSSAAADSSCPPQPSLPPLSSPLPRALLSEVARDKYYAFRLVFAYLCN